MKKIFLIFLFIVLSVNVVPALSQKSVNETNQKSIDHETGVWKVYSCDGTICDVSHWFADSVFGIIIASSFFIWQSFENRKRSSYFIGQIYHTLYPIMFDLYELNQEKSLEDNIPSESVSDEDFQLL